MRLPSLSIMLLTSGQIHDPGAGLISPEGTVTELHQPCSYEESTQARCGPAATCLLIGGVPTCHCIRDVATGLPLAGNPYRGCTWDISGTWELEYHDGGTIREIYAGITSEPYAFKIERTDAVLKTRYMTGSIFVVWPVTSSAAGIAARAFVDVNDNSSVIFEAAEGFIGADGRSLYFKNNAMHQSLTKCYPIKEKPSDRDDLRGGWKRADGSKIKMHRFSTTGKGAPAIAPPNAYWYNDDSLGVPHLRLSTALFVDETLDFEQASFGTTDRFIQMGWYGQINKGNKSITILSPADGKEIFRLRQVREGVFPTRHRQPQISALKLEGIDQIDAVRQALDNASPPTHHRRLEPTQDVEYSGEARLQEVRAAMLTHHDESSTYPLGGEFRKCEDYNSYVQSRRLTEVEKLGRVSESWRSVGFNVVPIQGDKAITNKAPRTLSKSLRKLQGLFERLIGDQAARLLDRAVPEPERKPVEAPVYQATSFYGIESTGYSPYDYLYIKPAERLSSRDKTLEEEFVRAQESGLRRFVLGRSNR